MFAVAMLVEFKMAEIWERNAKFGFVKVNYLIFFLILRYLTMIIDEY